MSGDRGQVVPFPVSSTPFGFLYRNRIAYLRSTGSPSLVVPYSTEWNDTSQATRLVGVWDSPAGTPLGTFSQSVATTGINTPTGYASLMIQYSLPAWDEMPFFQNVYDGLLISGIDFPNSDGGGAAFGVQATITGHTGTGNWFVAFASIVRVFDLHGNLRYTITGPINQVFNSNRPFPVASYVVDPLGTNALATFTNVSSGCISNAVRLRNLIVNQGDYPVVEVGCIFFQENTGTMSGTMTYTMGDNQPVDNIGGGFLGTENSIFPGVPANSNCVFSYRSNS